MALSNNSNESNLWTLLIYATDYIIFFKKISFSFT